MRNQMFILAVTVLICLGSFGKLQASETSKKAVAPVPLKLPPTALGSDPAIPLKTAPRTPAQDAAGWTGFYAGGHGGSGSGPENFASPPTVRP